MLPNEVFDSYFLDLPNYLASETLKVSKLYSSLSFSKLISITE